MLMCHCVIELNSIFDQVKPIQTNSAYDLRYPVLDCRIEPQLVIVHVGSDLSPYQAACEMICHSFLYEEELGHHTSFK